MTSVTRSNFEKSSQFITIDEMKKKIDMYLIPYISVVILDDSNKVQVRCEAIVTGETFDAYKFMLEFYFQITLSVDCRAIQFIFCDEFLTVNFL